MKPVYFLALIGLLAACSPTQQMSQAFPNRAQFGFLAADRPITLIYLCERSATEAETLARAQAAHARADAALRQFEGEMIDRLARSLDQGRSVPSAAVEMQLSLNAGISDIIVDVEARHQCLLTEARS